MQSVTKPIRALIVVGGALLVAFFPLTWREVVKEPAQIRHEEYQVDFVWEDGLKRLDVFNKRTALKETNSELDRAVRQRTAEVLTGLTHRMGVARAKGTFHVSLDGTDDPYLIIFKSSAISEPPVELFVSAAAAGRLDTVSELISEGMPVNAKESYGGRTALMFAAGEGHDEVAQALLAAGADPNVQDDIGLTALMVASGIGNAEIVKLLLSNGARSDLKDSTGRTALDSAKSRGHTEIVDLLTEHIRKGGP